MENNEPPPYNIVTARGIEPTVVADCSISMKTYLDPAIPSLGTKFDLLLRLIEALSKKFALLDTEADKEFFEIEEQHKNKISKEKRKKAKANKLAEKGRGLNEEQSQEELIRIRNHLRQYSSFQQKDIKQTPLDYGAESTSDEDGFMKRFVSQKKKIRDAPKDEGGIMTYTFSKKSRCLGDINSCNLHKKLKSIKFGDRTYISPALEMMREKYLEEQLKKSNKGIPWSPKQLTIVITDGELHDGEEFEKLISSKPYEDVYLLVAI